jgi:hypothetical protein
MDSKEKKPKKDDMSMAERAALKVGAGMVKGGYKLLKATGKVGAQIGMAIGKKLVEDALEDKKDELKANMKDKIDTVHAAVDDAKNRIKKSFSNDSN